MLFQDDHRHLVDYIEAAARFNKPPFQLMFGEEEWPLWTKYDSLISVAYERYQRYQTSDGHPIFWDQSQRVKASVKTYKSKAKAAMDEWDDTQSKKLEAMRKTNPHAHLERGIVPYVIFEAIDGGPMPTLEEWVTSRETNGISVGAIDSLLSNESYLQDIQSEMTASAIADKYGVPKSEVMRHMKNPTPFVPDLEKAAETRAKIAKSKASQTVTQR